MQRSRSGIGADGVFGFSQPPLSLVPDPAGILASTDQFQTLAALPSFEGTHSHLTQAADVLFSSSFSHSRLFLPTKIFNHKEPCLSTLFHITCSIKHITTSPIRLLYVTCFMLHASAIDILSILCYTVPISVRNLVDLYLVYLIH